MNSRLWMMLPVYLCALASVFADSPSEKLSVVKPILVLTEGQLPLVEKNAIDIFIKRIKVRTGLAVTVKTIDPTKLSSQVGVRQYGLLILAGVASKHELIMQAIKERHLTAPSKEEGYLISIKKDWGWIAKDLPNTNPVALICGKDSRGLLYGLGKFLRLADMKKGELTIPALELNDAPAIAQRGVYFATHMNNYYECAPAGEIDDYIEDIAFWGFNHVFTWFDMNWYPEDFWRDPNSRGMHLMSRIRQINQKARSLGLEVGLVAVANEGFNKQPPKQLRADASEKRGGYYPDSTICPSKPGGMEMILKNRRRILELVGPLDVYVTWPFDQGSCGCADCRPWVKTYMKINHDIAQEVRHYNPKAKFIVSTWCFKDAEMGPIQTTMSEGKQWFDGVLTETRWPGKFNPPPNYSRLVFPEISMYGSLLAGYGASGANPMPRKFLAEARSDSQYGYGAILYSEGIFEDLNKVIWACSLWNPKRSAEDIVEEYSRFYFGHANAKDGADLILGLEGTWPPENLNKVKREDVERLFRLASRMGEQVPDARSSRVRWQYLKDRAEMDWLMVQIGDDKDLVRQAKLVFDESAYTSDFSRFRVEVRQLHDQVEKRAAQMDGLFKTHWDYLCRAHLERTATLVITPPGFIGQRDWSDLLKTLNQALSEPDNEKMRTAMLMGFKRWFWQNNITLGFLLL